MIKSNKHLVYDVSRLTSSEMRPNHAKNTLYFARRLSWMFLRHIYATICHIL